MSSGYRIDQSIKSLQQSWINLRQRSATCPNAAKSRRNGLARMCLAMFQFTDTSRNGIPPSPVAAETVVTPPQPMADASAAAHCLRIRSSITGHRAKYTCRIRSIDAASCMHRPSSKYRIPTRRNCSTYCFAVPYTGLSACNLPGFANEPTELASVVQLEMEAHKETSAPPLRSDHRIPRIPPLWATSTGRRARRRWPAPGNASYPAACRPALR